MEKQDEPDNNKNKNKNNNNLGNLCCLGLAVAVVARSMLSAATAER